MIPKRAILKLCGLTLIPVVSIGFLISEYFGVWDRYYGLHHVLKAADRLETSYAPDVQRVVEPHDPEWEPMLDLIQRYSLTHLPADREPKFLARFQAMASGKIDPGSGQIAEWTAPSTPIIIGYFERSNQEPTLDHWVIVGTIGDLRTWVEKRRTDFRLFTWDIPLLLTNIGLVFVVWLSEYVWTRRQEHISSVIPPTTESTASLK